MLVRLPERGLEVGEHPPGPILDEGAPMRERVPEPWYSFIDGPRKPNGERDPFYSRTAAVIWMTITFGIAAGLLGAIGIGVVIVRDHIAIVGVLVPLVIGGAPIAFASLMAFIHTSEDLIRLFRVNRVQRGKC